mgnify:CR=1 FL=1
MREGDGDQPFRPHDLGRLHDQPRGKLHRLAMLAGKLRDEAPMTGDYLAVWKKVIGQWVIEQELYVTLS